ncbi:MAG: restriction endonuclease [Saprospiraceae bacterium]|nr:restriction endonuclease [Saprospiraceae bacterium]
MKKVNIIKANGETAIFDVEKLIASLKKAGASDNVALNISDQIEQLLYENISTKEIYKTAFSKLKKIARPIAARYKLKKAIMQLGPSGFPFEKYIAEILKHQGYEVEVGQIVIGHCVQHEIDVIAQKGNQHFMVECKFHSDSTRYCNVKIPLYIQSRFLDVEKKWKLKPGHGKKFHQGWIATNTRFTSDAMQYGNCMGLYLLGWNHPQNGSLKERIDMSGLHPLTCLTTLSRQEKQKLLNKMVVLCKDLNSDKSLLQSIGMSESRIKKVMDESKALCESSKNI